MQPSVSAVFQRGPRFFEADGELMFENVLDSRSKVGPRPATEDDLRAYREAFEKMGEPLPSPLGSRVVIAEEHAAPPVDKPHARRRDATLKG